MEKGEFVISFKKGSEDFGEVFTDDIIKKVKELGVFNTFPGVPVYMTRETWIESIDLKFELEVNTNIDKNGEVIIDTKLVKK
ncbi:MAG: hypothetical protein WEA99_10400 [Brumimicrobium sp.]